MLAVPTVGTFCTRLGVSSALTGVIVGASDFASMFATPGARPRGRVPLPAARSHAGARRLRRRDWAACSSRPAGDAMHALLQRRRL